MSAQADEARELCGEHWFRNDLKTKKDSAGKPLWDGQAKLTCRNADAAEVITYKALSNAAMANDEYFGDDLFVAF